MARLPVCLRELWSSFLGEKYTLWKKRGQQRLVNERIIYDRYAFNGGGAKHTTQDSSLRFVICCMV